MKKIAALAICLWLGMGESAWASTGAADAGCRALVARVDAIAGDGPVFLQSFEGVAEPALANAAFTYDNALAAMALVACEHPRQARRIGDALLLAANQGRLRNAYRAGPQTELPPPPNGWWDGRANIWVEDAYQVGTATGNVAWAGLALLALGGGEYRDGAARLGDWIIRNTMDRQGGFTGGLHGADTRLGWKSTEHNVDAAALLARLGRPEARQARAFVATMFDAASGHFWTGTLPDGVNVNRASSGLDAQLWPLMLPDAPPDWRRALAYAERAHGAEGGFDFNDDRDGLWVEGTAQAALAYDLVGQPKRARGLLALIGRERSEGGLLYATRKPRITTGLAIGPDSVTDDFHYYRWPHLGATAWAVLAAKRFNPFTD